MISFNHYLRELEVSNELRSLLYHIARSVKYINFSIRAGNTGLAKSENIQGETQDHLDILADKIISKELEKSELAALIASEEQDETKTFKAPRGNYAVTYDPLDGSSLIDSNLTIGSIFGIWKNGKLIDQTGRNLEASCYSVYGPRIILVIAIQNKGVHEFELNDVGEFCLTRKNLQIKEETKYFAPGNLRAAEENPKYKNLLNHWITKQKKLRYSGGMVPDLHHILSKGQGIFAYPKDNEHKNGKLRLLFECAPFAFIFEQAGGTALDQEGTPILDIKTKEIHQRTPIFIGSKKEVENSIEFLK